MEDKWDTLGGNVSAATETVDVAGWFEAAAGRLWEGLAADTPFDGLDDLDDFGAF